MAPKNCTACQTSLRPGETLLCAPCLSSAIGTPAPPSTAPRPLTPKQVAAQQYTRQIQGRAGSQLPLASQLANHHSLSTGDLRHRQLQQQSINKAQRELNRQVIGKKRTASGYGAAPKPPIFQHSGPSALSSTSLSIGYKVLYNQTYLSVYSDVQQQSRAMVAIDIEDPHLVDTIIKKSLLQWPKQATKAPESHYPRPIERFDGDDCSARHSFFKLAKMGAGRAKVKPLSIFGDPDPEEQRISIAQFLRTCKGDPPLELIYDADEFYLQYPDLTRPVIPEDSFPLSLSPPKSKISKRKKTNFTSKESAQDLDSSLPHPDTVLPKYRKRPRSEIKSSLHLTSSSNEDEEEVVHRPKRKRKTIVPTATASQPISLLSPPPSQQPTRSSSVLSTIKKTIVKDAGFKSQPSALPPLFEESVVLPGSSESQLISVSFSKPPC